MAQQRARIREDGPPRNHFLANLPAEDFQRLSPKLVFVDLPQGMLLSDPDEPIAYNYFPETGLISTNATTPAGESIEVGMIGREGFSGVAALLGQPEMQHTVVMQTPGAGYRVRSSVLLEELQQSTKLRTMVDNFLYVQMVTATQSVLCARLHGLQQRLARWLLTAQDRTGTDTLHFTQEFLAMMLGARRTTVTLIAGVLQRQGLIQYQRGRVKILKRAELEAASCDCYQITKELYASLYRHPVRTAEVEVETSGAVPATGGLAEKAGQAVGNGAGAGKSGHKALVGSAKSGNGRGAAAKRVSTSSKR